MSSSPSKLSFGRIALYSLASVGLNILSITVSTWLLFFYVPPADSGRPEYLPASLVGILMGVVGVWDALIDPFIGQWSDTLRSRWGRRRPFLILGAPLVALAVILLWTPPQSDSLFVRVAYFLLVTIGFFTTFSLVGIPYDATLPEMAPESKERLGLSYWKNVFGLAGVLVGSMLAAPLFGQIGAVAMGAVVGGVALVTLWLAAAGIKERSQSLGAPLPVMKSIRITLQNRQFLFVFLSTLLVHIGYQMLIAVIPYFVTLIAGKAEDDVAIFQGVLIIVMALSGPLWLVLNRKHSQRFLLQVAMIALTVILALGTGIGWLPGDVMLQGVIVFALIGVALGGYLIVVYALMGNVVDYDEMLTGGRREAIYYGTFSLALGLGIAFGSAILPQILDTFGFTRQNPTGVRVAFLAMSVFTLAGYLVFRGYRLGDTPEETRQALHLNEAERGS